MSWDAIPSIINKLLGRFLPNRKTALRDQITDLEKKRDKILNEPQATRNTERLTVVLYKLSRAKKRLRNAA